MPYEIDFLRAGESNGDAIVIRWGDTGDGPFYINIIDGGSSRDTGDQGHTACVEKISQSQPRSQMSSCRMPITITPPGLSRCWEHEDFTISNLWMNRPWDYVDEVLDRFHVRLYPRRPDQKDAGLCIPTSSRWKKLQRETGTGFTHRCKEPRSALLRCWRRAARGTFGSFPTSIKPLRLQERFSQSREHPRERPSATLPRGSWSDLDFETLDNNPPATSASNETSVVQMATFGDKRILLTADVGPEDLDEAAVYAEKYQSHYPTNACPDPSSREPTERDACRP